MIDLEQEWFKLAVKYSADQNLIKKLFYEIEVKYSEKHRYYHNLSHIRALLFLFEKYGQKVQNSDVVKLSIWYHDIIYKPMSKDNELQSAELAKDRLTELNVPTEIILKVYDYIMSTKTHTTSPDDYDQSFFLDLDLSILGTERNNYINYSLAIREENRIIPGFIYNYLRKKILKNFLHKEYLFYTLEIRDVFEKKAKENLNSGF